ncbi:hypothetical protein [Tahibacter caeni]|uniref:hypothetical protein n=1 Tax=Tahibacter caeni TaxID=1453545 RepID=UPI002149727B|nr:hypothetical protein [Tahibacter caeni]
MKSTAMLLAAAAAAVATVTTAPADAAGRDSASRRAVAARPAQPQAPLGGAVELYSQLGTVSTNGALSSQFSSSSGAPYDSEGADDFVVPAAGWRISTVEFAAFVGNGTTGAFPTVGNVRIYANAAGVPGTTVCNYPSVTVAYNTSTQIATVNLPGVCDLTAAGTYWITYQPIYDFGASGGDYYWNLSTPQAGAIGQWRNPGDGFESGCTAWSPNTSCGFTQPDYAFRLLGQVLPVSLQSFGID